ncbi:glycosyltransferase family 4 protein [Salinisphaera sp. SPP-AMP-43]|uniref:glycosyltransferase family 4 protein n=1 Tax=Salinisphaera sp. SPP-AMP-43 TaxID=3121288 RepID=UPI003C6E9348
MSQALPMIVAGDPEQYTGGYIYDARIAAALTEAGCPVERIGLAGRFPEADPTAASAMHDALADLADGTTVIIDGLALGGLPNVIAEHAGRLILVALIHHPLADESGIDEVLAARLYDSERQALAQVAHVVVTSRFIAQRLIDGYGVAKQRLDIVEPGLDKPSTARRPDAAVPRLLCVASLIPRKGHTILIDALARIAKQHWHCDCIGDLDRDPDCVAEARRAIAAHQLNERIELLGSRPPASLSAAYQSAHLFVLPSYYEGYGMVITEALAHGLPVVTTTGGALADTLPNDAGIAVPPGDAQALADALQYLLSDAAAYAELAAGARRAGQTLPGWSDAGQRFAAVLNRMATT